MISKVLEINVDDVGYGGVFSLVKNVIENKPESLEIDIAAIEKFEHEENISELKSFATNIYYVGETSNKALKQIHTFINLRRLIKEHEFNCVHIHADTANKLLVSGLAAKSAGVKRIILHSHASGVDGNNRGLKKVMHYICRPLLKHVGTVFVSCSDLAAEWMYPNIKKQNIIEIFNGINLDKYDFNPSVREKIRSELNLQDNFVIGNVGRFAYQKNHSFMINMFAQLVKQVPSAKLLLVGEGSLRNEIEQLTEQLKLKNRVLFYGSSNHVERLLQAIDVFVLPSHFEGLPIVGVEAQASALPIVFSDKITSEVAITSNTSFLPIDSSDCYKIWADKILEYKNVRRESTLDQMKKAGFDIGSTVAAFMKLYQ